ncbi:MAG: AAA family ATPase [Syntrophobacteraceae bacterium]|jgi:predicted ABC-type ATPase
MTKWLWIVAGPNGAGKSTHAAKLIADLQASGSIASEIIALNADERTAELKKQFPDRPQRELNLQAAQAIDAELVQCIAEDKPIIFVETVLSSTKYQDDVREAKARGYNIGLTFVSVYPPELILDRIKDRVTEGGHDVEAQSALDRYKRSHANLIWFGQHADKLLVFDNSGLKAVLVAVKEVGKKLTQKVKGLNPVLDDALRAFHKGKLHYLSF